MDSARIVARFADGRIMKGYTRDFSPNRPVFHLVTDQVREATEAEALKVADLKALFFVRSFGGNPDYAERKEFSEGDKAIGRKVEVTFADNEILRGSAPRYKRQETGFFMFPVDPLSNNQTLFVVNAAVKKLRYLRFHSLITPEIPYQCLIPENRGTLLRLSEEERKLLKLVFPKVMRANSAREYIVENLGSAYLKVSQALLREMEGI
jgi:hypothetical protein